MLTALWGRAQAWLATAGVALAIILGAFLYGRADGKDAAREEQARAAAKARTQAKDIENEINGLDDRGVGDGLAKWLRDGKR